MSSIKERINSLLEAKPNVEDFKKKFVYKNGKLVWSGKYNEMPLTYLSYVSEIVYDNESYREAFRSFNKELNSLYEEAYNSLAEFMNWQDINKDVVNWICSKIWEDGHSSGYSEVINLAYDYQPLIEILRKK